MIVLKKIDVYGQLLLISLSFLLSVALRNEVFIYCYFIVGGWQIVSCLVQLLFNRHHPQAVSRRAYQWFLVGSIITIPLGSAIALLFFAPFAAIWYFFISFRELKVWQHRHFIQLR